jgi:hypothetical protein
MAVEYELTPEQKVLLERSDLPVRVFAKKVMGFESVDHMRIWLRNHNYILYFSCWADRWPLVKVEKRGFGPLTEGCYALRLQAD